MPQKPLTLNQPTVYRNLPTIPHDPTPPGAVSVNGFPIIGGAFTIIVGGYSGTPNVGGTPGTGGTPTPTPTPTSTPTGYDVMSPIQYTVGTGTTPLDGYLARNLAVPTGAPIIVNSGYSPVGNATRYTPPAVTSTQPKDDIIRPITYKTTATGPDINGYQMRDANNNLYVADSSFNKVTNPILQTTKPPVVREREKLVLTSDNQVKFTLAKTPHSPELVEVSYQGFDMEYGTSFTVTGKVLDITLSGFKINKGAALDVYYEIPA